MPISNDEIQEKIEIQSCTPAIGAFITGIDATIPLTETQVAMLKGALREHHMLIFRDQKLSRHQFIKFGAYFGQLEEHPFLPNLGPGMEEITVLHYKPGRPKNVDTDIWHADATFLEQPPDGAVLSAVQLPTLGGDTLWASMVAAYEALSSKMQRLLDGLRAEHAKSAVKLGTATRNDDPIRGVIHPVVRVHPDTGKRAIFVNDLWTRRIIDMDIAESQHLLNLIYSHCRAPEFQMRLRWDLHTVVVWDNRSTQHYAVADYSGERLMHRLMLQGDTPIGVEQHDTDKDQPIVPYTEKIS